MIYTSYFAKLKSLPEDLVPISICGKAPDWYKGLQYKKLAPKYDFFMKWKETHDDDYYVQQYYEQVLNKLNVLDVVNDLIDLVKTTGSLLGKNICLICYEKPEAFCHRHLVADWLISNGFACEEYNNYISK